MRCLTVFLLVTVIQVTWSQDKEETTLSNRWEKLKEFEDIFKEYSQAAEDVIKTARNTITDIRSKSANFVNEFFNYSMEVVNSKNITRTSCSEIVYNFMGMRRTFFTQLTKSETPLLTHITELEQKLNEINTTIRVYHGVAESRYLSCKMANESCVNMVNLWLEQETKLIACRLRRCQDETSKRPKRASKPCKPDEFTCSDRHCIKRSWICDGQFDCRDGSDEPAGCTKTCKDGFHCFRSLRCIDRSLICNHFNDCGDKTDELFCGTILQRNNGSYCSIENGLFKCPKDKCISIQHVCDGKNDCKNGTDEGELCGKGTCPQDCVVNGGVCFYGPQGPLCFPECPFGTFEAPGGCTIQPYLYESTVYDLLEGIPALITRHNARFGYLKMKAMYSFSLELSNVIKCQLGMSTTNL